MRDRNNTRSNIPESDLVQEYYIERPTAKLELSEQTLKTWLQKNIKNLERKYTWKTPLITLLPLLLTLMTAAFKDFLGLKAETCKLIWIIIIFGIILWLGYSLLRYKRSKKIDDMVNDLKQDMIKISTQ